MPKFGMGKCVSVHVDTDVDIEVRDIIESVDEHELVDGYRANGEAQNLLSYFTFDELKVALKGESDPQELLGECSTEEIQQALVHREDCKFKQFINAKEKLEMENAAFDYIIANCDIERLIGRLVVWKSVGQHS